MRITASADVLRRLRTTVRLHDLALLAKRFESRKITFGPVHLGGEVAENDQVIARRMIQEVIRPDGRCLRYVRQPLLINGEGGTIRSLAPTLGQHTDEIVAELG